jgi:transposase
MEEKQQYQGNRRRFTEECKRDAVELVRATGRPIAQIAQELGIYDSTVGNWVRQDCIDRGEAEGLTSDERARCASWKPRTPGCGWSVIYANEPSPFWVKETSTP